MNRLSRPLVGAIALGALVLAPALPSTAQGTERTVAADDFDDARFPCSFLCLFPPTSGNANEPVSADSAAPFRTVPVGITYVSNSDLDGGTGPNPRGASGLSASRPSTWGGNETATSLGASQGSIDTLLELDASSVEVDANAVRFSFVEGEQIAPTVTVAAYAGDGTLLDSETFVAGTRRTPVTVTSAGTEISRVNVSSLDGVVTLHGVSVRSLTGQPAPEPEPGPGPGCGLLPVRC